MTESIGRLPDESVQALRSTVNIISYLACVEELVQNAIDASATKIEVQLRKQQWACRVQDNGTGIRPQDFQKLGQRYCTSKAARFVTLHETATFGFRGEALASLAESSSLEVLSRHADSNPDDTHSLHIRGGYQLSLAPAALNRHLLHSGTVVQVRDLFFKWPARRKAAVSSNDSIRRAVQVLALLHPSISFTITDLDAENRKPVLFTNNHASILDRFRSFYGRALVQDHMELVGEPLDIGSVSGFVSFSAAVDRQFQFMCSGVNGRPLSRGSLHQNICDAFARSNWSASVESHERHERLISPHKRQRLQASNPRKGLSRHPVFFVNLHLPTNFVDLTLEPSKKSVALQNEDAMGQALQQLIFTSLISRGYKVKLEPHRGRLVPATEAIIPFRAIKPRPANISHPKNVTAPPIVTLDANPSDERQTLTWTDPATGIPTTVDARTGNTVLSQGSECVSPLTTVRSGNLPVDRSRLKTFRPTDTAAPAWMDNALLNWHGHLLGPRREMESHTQPPITPLDSPSAAVQASSNFFHSETFGTLDRVQLNEGKVISQFDEKFILLRHESVLYLVDQHAASERIQVEGYLRPLCSLNDEFETVPWKEQNRNILVSKSELATALCQLETFSRWGIFLEPPQQTELDIDAEWYTFSVIAVPKCVHARLSREIHLLQALITSFLSQLQDRPHSTTQKPGMAWTASLGDCPKGLLDLINSKACRKAIMFGDRLDLHQCEQLVAQLGSTQFPFQCAHGRPSIVPLVGLASSHSTRRPLHWANLKD